MQSIRDTILLRTLRLCRADVVEAIAARARPPSAAMLKELAELQLVIMATEATISDKADPEFVRELEKRAAA